MMRKAKRTLKREIWKKLEVWGGKKRAEQRTI